MGTILIVDDNMVLAETMATLLEGGGRSVVTAYEGCSALDIAREHLPQVIILDIGLPGKNGHEIAAELRLHPGMRTSLIIMVTGHGLPERERAMKAGVDHFFAKPADMQELAELVDKHLH